MYTQSNVVNTVGWRRRARHCWRPRTGAPVPYSMPARSATRQRATRALRDTARSPPRTPAARRTLARGARRSALLPAPRRLRVTSPKNAHDSISRRACPVRRRAGLRQPCGAPCMPAPRRYRGRPWPIPLCLSSRRRPCRATWLFPLHHRPRSAPPLPQLARAPHHPGDPAPTHHPCAPCTNPIDERVS